VILALDGRSSSGTTSLSRRLAEAVPGAAVVHADDIAWWHAAFDWAGLLAGGVLEPVRAGRAVAYRPPAWDARDRPGAVTVPAGISLLVVEGVGMAEEFPFLAADRPWERADLIVAGTPPLPHDPRTELVVACPPPAHAAG
jgi:hypothetical protein